MVKRYRDRSTDQNIIPLKNLKTDHKVDTNRSKDRPTFQDTANKKIDQQIKLYQQNNS